MFREINELESACTNKIESSRVNTISCKLYIKRVIVNFKKSVKLFIASLYLSLWGCHVCVLSRNNCIWVLSMKGEWVTLQVCLKTWKVLRVSSHWGLSSEFIFSFSSIISQLEFSVVWAAGVWASHVITFANDWQKLPVHMWLYVFIGSHKFNKYRVN